MRLKLLLIALLFGQQAAFASPADSLNILFPRAHNPAFVEPGGTFTVELRGQRVVSDKGIKAVLRNDLREWPLKFKSMGAGKILNGTEDGLILTFECPKDISPELMALEIRPAGTEGGISQRSLSVVPDFEQDFYILQQSDQHTTLDNAAEPGGKSSVRWGNGSKEALNWLAPVVNLINPRFILHTGDNMQLYHEANNWVGIPEAVNRVRRFMSGVSGYTVPTLVVTGNHDIGFPNYQDNSEWRKEYIRVMGQTTFSSRMGSFYVLATEWTNPTYLKWARTDLDRADADPAVKYKLLASHYFEGLKGHTSVDTAGGKADLLLVGHLHRTKTLQTEPYHALATATAQIYQRGGFFYFNRSRSGWTSEQPALHADGVNVHQLLGDRGKPTVSATFERANDGSQKSNKVQISNSLPHEFGDGRIRFIMSKGKYQAAGGKILSQYNFDGDKTAVLVRVNISKQGTTEVSIK